MLKPSDVEFTTHAIERMEEQGLAKPIVIGAVVAGDVVAINEAATTVKYDNICVVIANDKPVIVTAYYDTRMLWIKERRDGTFKARVMR